jgi:hypothetical protein
MAIRTLINPWILMHSMLIFFNLDPWILRWPKMIRAQAWAVSCS